MSSKDLDIKRDNFGAELPHHSAAKRQSRRVTKE